MIILSGVSDVLRLATSAASAVDAHVSFADSGPLYFNPDRTNSQIASIGTAVILAAVGSGLKRAVKALTITAKGGANVVTLEYFDGSVASQLLSVALAAGDTLSYDDAGSWRVLNRIGELKTVLSVPVTAAQSHIGWAPTASGQLSNVLTLAPAGHAPGFYQVLISQLVRTLASAGGGQETVAWSNGGAQQVQNGTSGPSGPRWTVLGLALPIGPSTTAVQFPRYIYSDGVSPITLQVGAVALTGTPVIDIHAAAIRVG